MYNVFSYFTTLKKYKQLKFVFLVFFEPGKRS